MKELCITCWKPTHHTIDEHISIRLAYIKGMGQLCLDCYDEIYIKPKRKENESKSPTTSREPAEDDQVSGDYDEERDYAEHVASFQERCRVFNQPDSSLI